ncbi:hypothetical protein NQ315_012395 [Exocentrus adspersus]|uniref:Maturase K n=1 Tax=Exocentrus adspersus TaxID=1586481 RepID=A0AAV8VMR1_9CUCU|nr:hypothetical protein NQ315_012395 [Exocentrus adspersus]
MEFDDDDIFEDDLDVLEIIEFGFPRQVYRRSNPFENLSELEFFKRYRLYKNTVRYLLTLIQEELEYPNNLNNAVSPIVLPLGHVNQTPIAQNYIYY